MSNFNENEFFCNDWDCECRKNEKCKNKINCDLVYDGCPYDEEFYKSLKEKEV